MKSEDSARAVHALRLLLLRLLGAKRDGSAHGLVGLGEVLAEVALALARPLEHELLGSLLEFLDFGLVFAALFVPRLDHRVLQVADLFVEELLRSEQDLIAGHLEFGHLGGVGCLIVYFLLHGLELLLFLLLLDMLALQLLLELGEVFIQIDIAFYEILGLLGSRAKHPLPPTFSHYSLDFALFADPC